MGHLRKFKLKVGLHNIFFFTAFTEAAKVHSNDDGISRHRLAPFNAYYRTYSDALISLHWLRAQDRVRFKTAVLMYKATHKTAPSYLSQLVRVADLPGRRSLRSARTNRLLVPSVKLSTVGGRAFPIAGPTIWNSLPDNVISAPS